MRILADENVPRPIVTWLRDTGHDVLYSAESRKQTPDADLLAEAEAQGYIVLTGDKDFGELIFRDHSNSHGVILLRMKNRPAAIRLARLQQVWTLVESRLPGHFVVVTASKIRPTVDKTLNELSSCHLPASSMPWLRVIGRAPECGRPFFPSLTLHASRSTPHASRPTIVGVRRRCRAPSQVQHPPPGGVNMLRHATFSASGRSLASQVFGAS